MNQPRLTPGRLLYLTRFNLKRGFRAAYHDYITSPRIFSWSNPYAGEPPHPVPVHIVGGGDHRTLTAWMLASWFHHTGRNWKVTLHDDGTFGKHAAERLRQICPDLKYVSREDADEQMASVLADFPHCRAYRNRLALALKCFDVPRMVETDRYISLDTDLMFYRRPEKILSWADDPMDDSCWFNEDYQEPSPLSPQDAESQLGIRLWPKVNSGLCLLVTKCADLDRFEQWLQVPQLRDGLAWRLEQALLALGASRLEKGGLLSSEYEVSPGTSASPSVVCRHYIGEVRQQFYSEGIRRAYPVLFGGAD